MKCGVVGQHQAIRYFPQIEITTLLEWLFREQHGFGLTAFALVSSVSAPYTNGVWSALRPKTLGIRGVPRFPAPEDEVSERAPTQLICRRIDSKNNLGAKGRRKLTRAPHLFVSRPARKLCMTVTSQNLRWDL